MGGELQWKKKVQDMHYPIYTFRDIEELKRKE